jgi:hypothetical protein
MDYGQILKLAEDYCLKAEADKIFGPYRKQDGRQIVIIKKDDGTNKTMSYPKFLLQEHLQRTLGDDETIDHKNFDFNDNRIENLQILPRAEHSEGDTRRVKLIKLKCQMCDKDFERSPRLMRDKSKRNVGGWFCGRSCAGKYSRQRQLGKIDKLPSPEHTSSEYYRKKIVENLGEELTDKYEIDI